jgi:hypothetical protein
MFKNLSIKTRLIAVLGFLAHERVVGFAVGILNQDKSNDAMKSMYDDRLVALAQLSDVERAVLANQILIARSQQPGAAVAAIAGEIEANMAHAAKSWEAYAVTNMTPDEKRMAEQFAATRKVFLEQAMKPTVAALRADDVERAGELLNGKMRGLAKPMGEEIAALVQLQLDVASKDFAQSQEIVGIVRIVCFAGLVLGLAVARGGGWLVVRAHRGARGAAG